MPSEQPPSGVDAPHVDTGADARVDGGPAGTRRSGWLIAALAVLTGVLGLLAVLAPVTAKDPVVTWPPEGQAATSTVLPLSPYRPLQFTATVPCTALQQLDQAGGGEALRTLPVDAEYAVQQGLTVTARGGAVSISSSGADLVTEPLPPGECTYRVIADAGGIRIDRDGEVLANRPALLPPQVAQLATDAPGAAGLSVTLHTDARYESSPTGLKTGLIIAHGLALAALLVLAWRRWRGVSATFARPRPSPADGVVLVVSLAWVALGPMNIDDSWYLLMSRNAETSGYIGNYIYQFNVSENPFVLTQYLMQAWGALGGWGLSWHRLLPLCYGLGAYALLRVYLTNALGRAGRLWHVPWLLAAAHLLWWLPYGMTLRPEPAIVTGAAGVLLLTEWARRRRSVGILAAATAVAALTLTVAPTGVVAATPLLLAVPWLWAWLRQAGWPQRIGAVLLAAASASVIIPVGFTDASLGDVLEATTVHRWYYRQHAWYEEFVHYQNLLAAADTGTWGKRIPVLLTIAALVTTLASLAMRRGTDATRRLLLSSAASAALALALLSLSPTKWVNHFGAVAAPATVLLTVALLRSPVRRAGRAPVIVAALVVGGAAAVSFAGPNLWRPFTDWGQPFGNHLLAGGTPYEISLLAPNIGPLFLRNPVLWLAFGVGVALLAYWLRLRTLTPERGLLAIATTGAVALLVLVFTLAPIRQAPGWSVASATFGSCGLAEGVRVLLPGETGLAPPGDTAELAGAIAPGPPPGMEPPAQARQAWHTDLPGGTGSVTTPWYPLPDRPHNGSHDTQLLVPLVGALDGETTVTLEVKTPGGTSERLLTPRSPTAEWVDVHVRLPASQQATAVRLVAADEDPDPDNWLGVGAPWLGEPHPVSELTAGAPVFADQVSAALWPCVDQVAVVNGIAEAPAFRLRAGDGLEAAIEGNSTFAPNGGAFTQVQRTAELVEVPSTLEPPGAATLQWGHVERYEYDHPLGHYDLRVQEDRRWGWVRLPPLTGEAYTGRTFIG